MRGPGTVRPSRSLAPAVPSAHSSSEYPPPGGPRAPAASGSRTATGRGGRVAQPLALWALATRLPSGRSFRRPSPLAAVSLFST